MGAILTEIDLERLTVLVIRLAVGVANRIAIDTI
jgi:hypothetical protein